MAMSAKVLAKMADDYYVAREKRRLEQKRVDMLKEKETALWEHLKDGLLAAKTNAIAGRVAHVEVVTKQKPIVTDLLKFHAYIKKNDAWDLLPKTVVASAARERWEDKVTIPGVDSETYIDLSIGKV